MVRVVSSCKSYCNWVIRHRALAQKALLYRDTVTGEFTTAAAPNLEAWLIKFPAQKEHPEVCAIEAVYNDVREKAIAFKRIVFNVAFNNRAQSRYHMRA